jgi:lipoprotein-anchoring transpeptidase ErfK/SrfK
MRKNWTDGCIALSNIDIDEIFSVVSLGTPVTILP